MNEATTPLAGSQRRVKFTTIQRFNQKWIKDGDSGCHLWISATNLQGYGVLHSRNSSCIRAHRFSWMISHGEIPLGMCVLHKCDRPRCVNPEHLFLGTRFDNMRDCSAKGRSNAARGENAGSAKLTESDVLEIRGSKESNRAAGERYGINSATVSRIRNRLRWRYLA